MGSAIFTGVTGLQVHQRAIDVVASNIANVNTTGYRGSRALFQDLFSQTLSGPSAPLGTFGGKNGSQVGLGVRLGAIDIDFTQGTLLNTGVASDLAIQGSGFFILSGGGGNFYSRDGSFTINANGELIDSATGLFVQGFQADDTGTIDPNAPLTNIAIPLGTASIVRATTEVSLVGNLDSTTAAAGTVVRSIQVFDSLGTERELTITFTKSATTNEWDWAVTSADPAIDTITGAGTIEFDANGDVTAGGIGNISVTFVAGSPAAPVDPFDFDLNFNELTQLASESDVAISNQDGYPRGTLESFNIGSNGILNGVFSNGLTQVLGQVALANFANTGGLVREGENLFRESPGSGIAQVGTPGTGGRGQVSGGVLEGSNVDLGTEFSNLIVFQRGFQANARTITTADTLLQETVNLVR
ncbi:MAG: flagellar hook protein FlgE [Candidatus Hydrogenedentes bacterium]|nr:flagellar hook protein FlgE [Candidatus Hydrogenedentota bacterium]